MHEIEAIRFIHLGSNTSWGKVMTLKVKKSIKNYKNMAPQWAIWQHC